MPPGRVQSLTTVQISWQKDSSGRFVPMEVPGSEKEVPAELVLLAMGFTGPEQPLLRELGIQTDARSNIAGRTWPVRDEHQRRVHRGGLSARSEPRRVGHQ